MARPRREKPPTPIPNEEQTRQDEIVAAFRALLDRMQKEPPTLSSKDADRIAALLPGPRQELDT